MNAYICNKTEVLEGTKFLNKFLDNTSLSKNYNIIIHENILEREIGGISGAATKKEFEELNFKLYNSNIKLYIILSSVPQEYYKKYTQTNIELLSSVFFHIHILFTDDVISGYKCGRKTWDEYNELYKRNLNTNSFSNLLLTLNRRPHLHRCIMMDYLAKYNLIDSMCYTWSSTEINYKFNWWVPKINQFNVDDECYNCKDVLYDNPAFHLVTESHTDIISFSEKTFKPILAGIPFLVFGARGFHKKLKEYGFELYDEIFNYSFDDIQDENHRAMGIAQNFSRLKNKNYQDIVNKIYHKVEQNRNHALDIFYDKRYIPTELYNIFSNYIEPQKNKHEGMYYRISDYLK